MKKKIKKIKKLSQKQTIKKVRTFLDEIQWLFQINNFDRQIVIKTEADGDLACEITYEEDYQRITIKIFPCFFTNNFQDQRKMILHELCHTITIPSKRLADDLLEGKLKTKDEIRDINERTTSQIENILDALLRGRSKYATQAYRNYLR